MIPNLDERQLLTLVNVLKSKMTRAQIDAAHADFYQQEYERLFSEVNGQ